MISRVLISNTSRNDNKRVDRDGLNGRSSPAAFARDKIMDTSTHEASECLKQLDLSPRATETIRKCLNKRRDSIVACYLLFAMGMMILLCLMISEVRHRSIEHPDMMFFGLFWIVFARSRIRQTRVKDAVSELLLKTKESEPEVGADG